MVWRHRLRRLGRSALIHSRASRISRRFTSGAGAFLLFHEIQCDPHAELDTGASPRHFENVLRGLQAEGWVFVTIDDALNRLKQRNLVEPFAAVTFDDAYRDNLRVALPILQRLNIPACLFVPTGVITRQIDPWWLALRRLIQLVDVVDVAPMNVRLPCAAFDQKVAALRTVSYWIIQSPDRIEVMSHWLAYQQDLSPAMLSESYFMSREELALFANHPLITIGAHTTRHLPLSTLSGQVLETELRDNKAFLEAELDRPVDHVAYPFGTPQTCGPREYEVARKAGFRAGYTTKSRVVPRQGANLFGLPRFDCGQDASLATVVYRVSGLEQAMSRSTGSRS